MKRYLGTIYFKNQPKNNFWTRLFGENKVIVHRFSDCIIEAETYLDAHKKMKEYADEYIAKAMKLPNTEFMRKLIYESFVTEQI